MEVVMSIEKAMIARAEPKILNAKLKDFVRDEVTKGCRPEISTHPVPLEPPFMPLYLFSRRLQKGISWLWL
jgi:hypothetical protein